MSLIFISHVEEDSSIAVEIAQGLEQAGYTTWYHERDSVPGPPYLSQVGTAIEEAQVIVLIVSINALSSNQVNNEVIRGYESGKFFIPLLHDISHVEFQQRQPVWRQALAVSTSIRIPNQGVRTILPRVIAGLKALGLEPVTADYTGKVAADTRSGTGLTQTAKKSSKAVESGAKQRTKQESAIIGKPIEEVDIVTHKNWFWAGIVLSSLAVAIEIGSSLVVSRPIYEGSWESAFGVTLIFFSLPLLIPGVICIRKGMSRASLTKPPRGQVPYWWWVLPLLFGFVGGIISWSKLKDKNWFTTMNLLTLGIISTILWTIPIWVCRLS